MWSPLFKTAYFVIFVCVLCESEKVFISIYARSRTIVVKISVERTYACILSNNAGSCVAVKP